MIELHSEKRLPSVKARVTPKWEIEMMLRRYLIDDGRVSDERTIHKLKLSTQHPT
jgi:hypothetical protein